MIKLIHLFLLSTNKLICLLFFSVFSLSFLDRLSIVPHYATWLPDLITIGISFIIALMFGINKRIYIDKKYLILIASYLTVILLGILLNSVSSGNIFLGFRAYLKHLPFFLLPAVYPFTEKEFKRQLMVILPLLLLQCPVSLYQRLFQFKGVLTGDVVRGTLEGSGSLSIILVCSIAVLFGFYLKKKISLILFSVLTILLLVPTTLNETKVTLIIFPIALLLPAFFNQDGQRSRIKAFLTVVICGILFISIFIPVYDYFIMPRTGYSVIDFFLKKKNLENYLYIGADEESEAKLRRGDALALAYKSLSTNGFTMAFGIGVGRGVQISNIKSLSDVSSDAQQSGSEMLTITAIFWELGLAGLLIYISFFIFLLADALTLKDHNSIFGDFALGWAAVTVIALLCLIYTNILLINSINLLFWYFSGVIAAKVCEAKNKDLYPPHNLTVR